MIDQLTNKPEIIIALASLTVAVVVLIFAAYQTKLNREHNRLSVRPHLFVGKRTYSEDDIYSIRLNLINNGLGPAIVKRYAVYFGGHFLGDSSSARNCIERIDEKMNELSPKPKWSRLVFDNGRSISAGDEVDLIKITSRSPGEIDYNKYQEFMSEFGILVEYESMYGERYSYDTRKDWS